MRECRTGRWKARWQQVDTRGDATATPTPAFSPYQPYDAPGTQDPALRVLAQHPSAIAHRPSLLHADSRGSRPSSKYDSDPGSQPEVAPSVFPREIKRLLMWLSLAGTLDPAWLSKGQPSPDDVGDGQRRRRRGQHTAESTHRRLLMVELDSAVHQDANEWPGRARRGTGFVSDEAKRGEPGRGRQGHGRKLVRVDLEVDGRAYEGGFEEDCGGQKARGGACAKVKLTQSLGGGVVGVAEKGRECKWTSPDFRGRQSYCIAEVSASWIRVQSVKTANCLRFSRPLYILPETLKRKETSVFKGRKPHPARVLTSTRTQCRRRPTSDARRRPSRIPRQVASSTEPIFSGVKCREVSTPGGQGLCPARPRQVPEAPTATPHIAACRPLTSYTHLRHHGACYSLHASHEALRYPASHPTSGNEWCAVPTRTILARHAHLSLQSPPVPTSQQQLVFLLLVCVPDRSRSSDAWMHLLLAERR